MHFGHIFHGIEHTLEHSLESFAIHEGESILEHAAIGVVTSLL